MLSVLAFVGFVSIFVTVAFFISDTIEKKKREQERNRDIYNIEDSNDSLGKKIVKNAIEKAEEFKSNYSKEFTLVQLEAFLKDEKKCKEYLDKDSKS